MLFFIPRIAKETISC